MKLDIILAGVGGQGILSIAAAIGQAALDSGLHIKQSEVHGMSQRGGAVMSHLRISSEEINSDLIPAGQADLIISVEPMESLRYLDHLSPEGWIITNTKSFENIPNYPQIDDLMKVIQNLPRRVFVDADQMAHEVGSLKASNMIMLGASLPFLHFREQVIENGIRKIFASKGEQVIQLNINAMKAGYRYAQDSIQELKDHLH